MTSFLRPAAMQMTLSALGRRRFVTGAGAVAALGVNTRIGSAAATPDYTGSHFDLSIGKADVNFTGRAATAVAVNGMLPGPTLRWRQGDTVTLAVRNMLDEGSSIHWHGIRAPGGMDGVPGLSFPGIPPGGSFTYRIPLRQAGTYWYHSHSGSQEQQGLYGAIIVAPRGGETIAADRDYVLLLSDWTDSDPSTIVSNLKFQSDYYNFHQRTALGLAREAARDGLLPALRNRAMWASMRMSATDIADVTGATYTYLLNGAPPAANWTALFRPGERARLRIINASSMTFFDVRIPGLPMTIVQADGNDVEPVTVDEFRIGVAETYDVIVRPIAEAYCIFAQSEDRSGFARGTLATRAGLTVPVPPMDPRPVRTMADMGMAMKSMPGMTVAKPAGAGTQDMDMTGHGSMDGEKDGAKVHDVQGMDMHGMGDVDDMDMKDMDMSGMDMQGHHGMHGVTQAGATTHGNAQPPAPSTPPATNLKGAVAVDNVAMSAENRLGYPGDGLETGTRRVLTYADLRAAHPGADQRPPSRDIVLHLTGNMARYIWGFDGRKFSEAEPIRLALGERVRFSLVNDTMMEHPIHLHGLWSELENGQGDYRPYKHTVIVQPGEKLGFLVTADTPGRWAFHCHLLYHMEMGMMRTVIVA